MVDPGKLHWECVVLDDGSAEGLEIEPYLDDGDQQPPQYAINDWQLAAQRYENEKNAKGTI